MNIIADALYIRPDYDLIVDVLTSDTADIDEDDCATCVMLGFNSMTM